MEASRRLLPAAMINSMWKWLQTLLNNWRNAARGAFARQNATVTSPRFFVGKRPGKVADCLVAPRKGGSNVFPSPLVSIFFDAAAKNLQIYRCDRGTFVKRFSAPS
jgi:hypothetical protein